MKNLLYLLLLILLINCNGYNSKDNRISSAFNYVLDSLITKQSNDNFSISSDFTNELNDSLIKQDLIGIELLDSLNFKIGNIITQNNDLKGVGLKSYIEDVYYDKINDKDDASASMHFVFGPPLFNEEGTSFLQYFIVVFNSSETLGWSHQYIVCSKMDNQWRYRGTIKISRDEVLNSID